jgi:hypothetical protein
VHGIERMPDREILHHDMSVLDQNYHLGNDFKFRN